MMMYRKALLNILHNNIPGRVRRGAEIGVWSGETSFVLLKKFKRLHLYMVDSYTSKNNPDLEITDQTCEPGIKIEDVLSRAVRRTEGYRKRRTIIIQESARAASLMKAGRLNFIFLDGSHIYEDVKADLNAWVPKVKRGGVVVGHDYNQARRDVVFGVQQAVDEYVDEHGYELHVDSRGLWHFIK